MRILRNILYVLTPGAYLALDGENVVLQKEGEELRRVPLHNLEGIVAFGYTGASPALMGACASLGRRFVLPHHAWSVSGPGGGRGTGKRGAAQNPVSGVR